MDTIGPLVIGAIQLVLFVIAIVSITKDLEHSEGAKFLWSLVAFFFFFVGPILWFFVGRRASSSQKIPQKPAGEAEEIFPRPPTALVTDPNHIVRPHIENRTNSMAILALVFALGGGLLSIVLGHVALKQISRTQESGRGLAIAGLTIGYFIVAFWIISGFIYFVFLKE